MLKVAGGGGGGAGSVKYVGTWDAATNTPTLTSGVGNQGNYYVVSVPGNTNLDGITDWQAGDWAIFNGTVWEKVDNSEVVYVSNVATGTGLTGGPITTTGTISLANTSVAPGVYGDAANVPQVTINAQGQATNVTNVAISISVANVANAVPDTRVITAGTGLSGGGNLASNVTIDLANTTVTAGTYGNATQVAQVQINSQGQVTNASNVSIAISAANVSGLGTMATQNANAVLITGGDATGLTNLAASNVNITGGNVTGLTNLAASNANITGGNATGLTNVSAANVVITNSLSANLTSSNTAAMPDPSLPLNPEGYITVVINGASKKIPYYGV